MDQIITVIPLGTVSPYPKEKRNCPGFLIRYNGKNILLDCGNGVGRLLHLPNDLTDLRVFISHFHKDHFGDLSSLQYASFVYHHLGMLDKKIEIYLPDLEYLENPSAIVKTPEAFAQYNFINEETGYPIDDIVVSFHNNHSHTIPSYVIKLENDWCKIVYTSDIGNTNMDALAEFCNNADLLICESSFIRSHHVMSSTHLHADEAAVIAKKAEVKQLMLTHFWPETPKSEYLREAREIFDNTIVAEEGKHLVLKR